MPDKKNIIITGGSSGLGLELARHYAKKDNNIGLIARNPGKLQSAVEQLQILSPGIKVTCRSADVSDTEAAGEAISQLDELNRDRTPENRAHVLMIPTQPLEVIVKSTVKAIESGRYHTLTGFKAKSTAFGIRHFPRISQFVADRVIRKAGKNEK